MKTANRLGLQITAPHRDGKIECWGRQDAKRGPAMHPMVISTSTAVDLVVKSTPLPSSNINTNTANSLNACQRREAKGRHAQQHIPPSFKVGQRQLYGTSGGAN